MANEAAAAKEVAAAKSNDGPAPVIKWANPELIIRRCKIGKDWLKHHEPKKRKELFVRYGYECVCVSVCV